MPSYRLSINGTEETVDVPADMPLLWLLREVLGLTGTKYGCGIGQCRACTVHIDGAASFSCIVPASSVEGAEITTIEGLSAERKDALVDAWVEEQVPQCGYCQPGQVMSAAALLRERPSPTDDDIDQALSPNLCRCGTYVGVRDAVLDAARKRKGGR